MHNDFVSSSTKEKEMTLLCVRMMALFVSSFSDDTTSDRPCLHHDLQCREEALAVLNPNSSPTSKGTAVANISTGVQILSNRSQVQC